MNGRIGRLHCKYQVSGAPSLAGAPARLDRLAAEQVPQALAAALDRVMGDDEAVYVVRTVRTRVSWNRALDDPELVSAWGDRLAGAVVRALADGDDAVRFEDESDYVGHFLADLVGGRAWELWFYGAFAPMRGLGTAGAARAVLLEHQKRLPAVLAVIRRLGILDQLLALVDDGATLERLWRGGSPAAIADPDGDPGYPVFLAALRFADRLGLWVVAKPAVEDLWRAYVASGPLPATWRDRGELTDTFMAVLSDLAAAGHLRLPAGATPSLERALAEVDWLDTARVRSFLTADGHPEALPVRAAAAPTSRHRQLVANLAALMESGELVLEAGPPSSAANWLRVLAALGQHAEDDPLPRTMIERLLAAASELRAEAIESLADGDADGALRRLPRAAVREAAAPAYRFLARLGPDAVAVAAAVAGQERDAPRRATVESPCAGVSLLLRAAVDTRLIALAEQTGYPAGGELLLSLALRWAGGAGMCDGRIDAGLTTLLDTPLTLEDLRAAWEHTPARAHEQWLAEITDRAPPAETRDADALSDGVLGVPASDVAIGNTAAALLRAWARWLRGFSTSSAPFLLESLIRRPGTVERVGEDVVVRLEPRPLDVVLGLAGYTDDLELAALGQAGVLRFALEGP